MSVLQNTNIKIDTVANNNIFVSYYLCEFLLYFEYETSTIELDWIELNGISIKKHEFGVPKTDYRIN